MNRREAITAVAAGVVTAAVSIPAAHATPPANEPVGLRAVWRWHEPTKEWIRCRMDTIKKGDTFSIELDERTGRRFVGVATSHPKYQADGVCCIESATGEEIKLGPGQHWLY